MELSRSMARSSAQRMQNNRVDTIALVLAALALGGSALGGCFTDSPCPTGTYVQRNGCAPLVDQALEQLLRRDLAPPTPEGGFLEGGVGDGTSNDQAPLRCPYRHTPETLVGTYRVETKILSTSCGFVPRAVGETDVGTMVITLDGATAHLRIVNSMITFEGAATILPTNEVSAILSGAFSPVTYEDRMVACFSDKDHSTAEHKIEFSVTGFPFCAVLGTGTFTRE